jgi:Terpene synthase family 2, C-terminal metal binding
VIFADPLESPRDAAAAKLDAQSYSWACQFGIGMDQGHRDKLARIRVGGFCSGFAQGGSSNGLQILSDLLMWLSACDDEFDEWRYRQRPSELLTWISRIQRMIELPVIAQRNRETDDAYAAAIRDLKLRLADIASPSLVARWAGTVRAGLFAWAREAVIQAEGDTPSLDDYATTRIESIVMKPLLAVAAAIQRPEISDAELQRPDVLALSEMVSLTLGIYNDVIGYAGHDLHDDSVANNILHVLAPRESNPATTRQTAIAIHNSIMVRFLSLRDGIIRTAGPELARYLDSLTEIINCSHRWASSHGRDRMGIGDSIVSGWLTPTTGTPTALASKPVPISTIDWWWAVPAG